MQKLWTPGIGIRSNTDKDTVPHVVKPLFSFKRKLKWFKLRPEQLALNYFLLSKGFNVPKAQVIKEGLGLGVYIKFTHTAINNKNNHRNDHPLIL